MTMTDYRKEFEKVLSQQAASKLPASQKQRSGKEANLRSEQSSQGGDKNDYDGL